MSMEVSAWTSMYHAVHARRDRRPFSAATLRRIGRFARPHPRALIAVVTLSSVTAALAVATPLLAGRVVDAIIGAEPLGTVVFIAAVIAVIALAEAGLGLLARWF